MIRYLPLPVLLFAASALAAPPLPPPPGYQPLPDASPPQRMSTLVVYGKDPCPASTNGEIVVCAREPESERYRVPKRFREKKALPAQGSWTANARMLDQVAKQGVPNSCSPVGSGGQSGCYAKFLADARAQRQADKEAAAADAP